MAAAAALYRLEARLLAMPHEALAALAAQLVRRDFLAAQLVAAQPTLLAHAEAAMAAATPLPAWAVGGVLLSPDLSPSVFSHLEVKHHAVARACTVWRDAWRDMLQEKRVLRPAKAELPGLVESLATEPGNMFSICASPSGSHVAVSKISAVECVWRRDHGVQRLEFDMVAQCIALSDAEMWVSVDRDGEDAPARLCRLRLSDYETLAETETRTFVDASGAVVQLGDGYGADEINYFTEAALSPDADTLFVKAELTDDSQSVLAVCARTLAFRRVFIEPTNIDVCGLAVVGDELFVGMEELRVFSLAGEPRRVVQCGALCYSAGMCSAAGSLYVLERPWPHPPTITMLDPHNPNEPLQRYSLATHRDEYRGVRVRGMCVAGDKLLVLEDEPPYLQAVGM